MHEGEILGIAGLAGSGMQELAYALAGKAPSTVSGRIRLPRARARVAARSPTPNGSTSRSCPPTAAARASSPSSRSPRTCRSRSWAGSARAASSATAPRARSSGAGRGRLEVKASSPAALISTLSGGNQQKVVLGRCLARDPELLVLSEPTAGVDIGTRVAIYDLIAGLARDGLTVVVSSSDVGDLLAMCTRIVVLRNGHVAAELGAEGLTEHALVRAMEGEERVHDAV